MLSHSIFAHFFDPLRSIYSLTDSAKVALEEIHEDEGEEYLTDFSQYYCNLLRNLYHDMIEGDIWCLTWGIEPVLEDDSSQDFKIIYDSIWKGCQSYEDSRQSTETGL